MIGTIPSCQCRTPDPGPRHLGVYECQVCRRGIPSSYISVVRPVNGNPITNINEWRNRK